MKSITVYLAFTSDGIPIRDTMATSAELAWRRHACNNTERRGQWDSIGPNGERMQNYISSDLDDTMESLIARGDVVRSIEITAMDIKSLYQ